MITVKVITNGSLNTPERDLTNDELKTVTSSICNGVEYIFYQGDEPIQEIIE